MWNDPVSFRCGCVCVCECLFMMCGCDLVNTLTLYVTVNCYCVVIGCKSVSSVPSSVCSRCFDYEQLCVLFRSK